MKIFLDTANVKDIKKWVPSGLIDGVTTNPSLLSKEGKKPKEVILAICDLLPDGEISVEVTETEPKAIYKQAKEISKLASNIVVKIPCHKDYYEVIKLLVEDAIPLNITLVFSMIQGFMMAKLGVRYISPFIGRLDDLDVNGLEILPDLRSMIDHYGYDTEILAASLRSVRHVHMAILSGTDVATCAMPLFEKMVVHPLTDQGMKKFDDDWKKSGIKQFP